MHFQTMSVFVEQIHDSDGARVLRLCSGQGEMSPKASEPTGGTFACIAWHEVLVDEKCFGVAGMFAHVNLAVTVFLTGKDSRGLVAA